jgi:hypothetical protein
VANRSHGQNIGDALMDARHEQTANRSVSHWAKMSFLTFIQRAQ